METAEAALRDNRGGEVPPALREFASIKKNDAEEACHKLFAKYGLTIPVKIEEMNVGPGELAKFPFLPFSSWMRYLIDHEKLHLVTGVSLDEQDELLSEFWLRYQANHPRHQLFELARDGAVDLAKCLPVFCHVDEGRTYKSKGIMILSVHGSLGRGTRAYRRRLGVRRLHIKQNPMGMNYMGNTWSTQFIFCSLLRTTMHDSPDVLDQVLEVFSADMAKLAVAGVTSTNGRRKYWAQLLCCKGDLPALQKVGGLRRNYARVPKKRNPETHV